MRRRNPLTLPIYVGIRPRLCLPIQFFHPICCWEDPHRQEMLRDPGDSFAPGPLSTELAGEFCYLGLLQALLCPGTGCKASSLCLGVETSRAFSPELWVLNLPGFYTIVTFLILVHPFPSIRDPFSF